MTPSDWHRGIAVLREQIERDSVLDPCHYERHLALALVLLHKIARSDGFPAHASVQVSHVERALHEFYNPHSTRGWAQRFALNALDVLETLCIESAEGEEEPRFAA